VWFIGIKYAVRLCDEISSLQVRNNPEGRGPGRAEHPVCWGVRGGDARCVPPLACAEPGTGRCVCSVADSGARGPEAFAAAKPEGLVPWAAVAEVTQRGSRRVYAAVTSD